MRRSDDTPALTQKSTWVYGAAAVALMLTGAGLVASDAMPAGGWGQLAPDHMTASDASAPSVAETTSTTGGVVPEPGPSSTSSASTSPLPPAVPAVESQAVLDGAQAPDGAATDPTPTDPTAAGTVPPDELAGDVPDTTLQALLEETVDGDLVDETVSSPVERLAATTALQEHQELGWADVRVQAMTTRAPDRNGTAAVASSAEGPLTVHVTVMVAGVHPVLGPQDRQLVTYRYGRNGVPTASSAAETWVERSRSAGEP